MKKVAVVGSGISGIASAYLWSQKYDVTVFEKNEKLGGHTDTTLLPDGQTIDTGFIVCNDRTYPVLHQMFNRLGIKVRDADMSFSYFDQISGQFYAGTNLNGIFARRRNILSVPFLMFLRRVLRFGKLGLHAMGQKEVKGITFGQFLQQNNVHPMVVQEYVLPMLASIWSAPKERLLEHPASEILAFLNNHGLLNLMDRPQWQTVIGGSQTYIDAICKQANIHVKTGRSVVSIAKQGTKVSVADEKEESTFDKVIVGVHAEDVLRILANPNQLEQDFFSSWTYEKNEVTVHTDISLMPPKRRAWASWNYLSKQSEDHEKLVMTYYATHLQGMQPQKDYFITLNAKKWIDPSKVLFHKTYKHPIFTQRAVCQREKFIEQHPKDDPVQYVGSYFGFGFHEDGVKSATRIGAYDELTFT